MFKKTKICFLKWSENHHGENKFEGFEDPGDCSEDDEYMEPDDRVDVREAEDPGNFKSMDGPR